MRGESEGLGRGFGRFVYRGRIGLMWKISFAASMSDFFDLSLWSLEMH